MFSPVYWTRYVLGPVFSEGSVRYEVCKTWHWPSGGNLSTRLSLRGEPHSGNLSRTVSEKQLELHQQAGNSVLFGSSSDSSSYFSALQPSLQILAQMKEVLLRWRGGGDGALRTWSLHLLLEVPKVPLEQNRTSLPWGRFMCFYCAY